MIRNDLAAAVAACALIMATAAGARAEVPLTVLTYNIEGLPWPARAGRAAELDQIADQLVALRAAGRQPHVILFEEAFSHKAKAIAARAGYRYVADGPGAHETGARATSFADRAFLAARRFLSIEKLGKLRGSGLRIASDYPILSVERMAYPNYACAGWDCLANKGAVLVTIAVPGAPQPVAIVNTHLNSRKAARTSYERSFYAFTRQVDTLTQFVRANIPAGMPFIVAGDFNAGQEARRIDYLRQSASGWSRTAPVKAALDLCLDAGAACPTGNRNDLVFSRRRGRDWQLFASGAGETLQLVSMEAPFGHDAAGHMLSDHVGYSATYRIETAPVLASAEPAAPYHAGSD